MNMIKSWFKKRKIDKKTKEEIERTAKTAKREELWFLYSVFLKVELFRVSLEKGLPPATKKYIEMYETRLGLLSWKDKKPLESGGWQRL